MSIATNHLFLFISPPIEILRSFSRSDPEKSKSLPGQGLDQSIGSGSLRYKVARLIFNTFAALDLSPPI